MFLWKHFFRGNVVSISSKQNSSILNVVRIREKRALRDEHHVFLVEGYRELCRVLASSVTSRTLNQETKQRFGIQEIYVCPEFFKDTYRLIYFSLLLMIIDIHSVDYATQTSFITSLFLMIETRYLLFYMILVRKHQ